MAAPKPTILFIHGGWHPLSIYQPFLSLLTDRGFDVVAPELPSASDIMPADPPGEDVALFAAVARDLIGQGKELVVVAHSYGGTVATVAMSGLGLRQRAAQRLQGGVRRMVFVCAFMPPKGTSLEDTAPIEGRHWARYEGDLKVLNFDHDVGAIFYPDLPLAQQQELLRGTIKHPKACSFYRPDAAAYEEIDTTFVYCEKDLAFPYPGQKAVVAAHKANGVKIDEVTLPSGHFPNLSMPERLFDVVLEYV